MNEPDRPPTREQGTYAVDRDAAITMIDALELFDESAPRLVMVSFAGARTAEAEDDGSSWHAYVESKKAVDQNLYASELPVTILGPTRLTDEPSKGISLLGATRNPESTISRELVGRGDRGGREPRGPAPAKPI